MKQRKNPLLHEKSKIKNQEDPVMVITDEAAEESSGALAI